MTRRLTATAWIAIVTVAISTFAIFSGIDYWAHFAGLIPARLSGASLPGAVPAWITPFSSALLHGSWLHLGVNMVMLLFVGTMVERVVGGAGLVFAYVVGGLVAAFAQFLFDPLSPIPMVGASGAISALFGLYALFFGRPRHLTANARLNRYINILWLLAAWVVLQWMAEILAGGAGVMIATPAHIGGFVAGLLLQKPLLLWRYRRA